MPDFNPAIRERLRGADLSPAREAGILLGSGTVIGATLALAAGRGRARSYTD